MSFRQDYEVTVRFGDDNGVSDAVIRKVEARSLEEAAIKVGWHKAEVFDDFKRDGRWLLSVDVKSVGDGWYNYD